jgi:hypothetical protein
VFYNRLIALSIGEAYLIAIIPTHIVEPKSLEFENPMRSNFLIKVTSLRLSNATVTTSEQFKN